jgi:hypothetical protein
MHVEVGALGEWFEEGVELAGTHGFGRVERPGSAEFAGVDRGGGFILSNGGVERRGEDESKSDTSAGHACLPERWKEVVQG